jgi:hypothetical protein
MATSRYRKSTPVTFNSKKLVDTLLQIATDGNRWFENVSFSVRAEFAEEKCVWLYKGLAPEDLQAACVVVSYPRVNGKVRVYNLDGGSFSWVPVKKLTKSRRIRHAEERDYEWNAIAMHDDRPESEDISSMIDWHEVNRKKG